MPARFVLAAILMTALPALAGDPPLPPLTPEGAYRVMTQDDATSTSGCIGNPVTPLCAVETVMACLLRRDDSLCRIGMGLDANPGYGDGTVIYERRFYRIMNAEIVDGGGRPWRPGITALGRPGIAAIQSGDVRIDISDKSCLRPVDVSECESEWFDPQAFIVRRDGAQWVVMIWGPADDRDYPRGSD